jgi:hypothetical protein
MTASFPASAHPESDFASTGQDNLVAYMMSLPVTIPAPQAPSRQALPGANTQSASPPDVDCAMLNTMENDPFCATQLDKLRHTAWDAFAESVDHIFHMLTVADKVATPAPVIGMATDLRTVIAISRRSESQGRHYRMQAEEIAFGHLHNFDNPAWDPLDPATSSTTDNVLLALLTGPPEP